MDKQKSILVLVVVLSCASICFGKYSGGTGEPNNPYQIATAEDLNDIGNHHEDFNKCFLVVADIDLADYTGTQFNRIGTDWNNAFTGVFDGNDHKVWNFTWTSTGRSYIGLFGYVAYVAGGQIKNLGLENVDVNAVNGYNVGGLVGYNYRGTITNCYSTGSVSGTGTFYTGGLVGYNSDGTITNCYSRGSVTGQSYVGGLAGETYSGTIRDCYSICRVTGSYDVGGLVGENDYGRITNCYSTGDVNGTGDYVGGLVGLLNDGTIINCYAVGTVTGSSSVGGLVGYNYYGTIQDCCAIGSVLGNEYVGGLVGFERYGLITDCYSTGSVSGQNYVGGLAGETRSGTTRDCYSTSNVSGGNYVGGLAGSTVGGVANCYSTGNVSGTGSNIGGLTGSGGATNSFWDVETSNQSTSGGGTGKLTDEMKTKSTFTGAGWDFVGETVNGTNDYWRMCVNGVEYPLLSWQFIGDFTCPDGVDILDLAFFVERWLHSCWWDNNFCNCTDTNHDGSVNFLDFAILASQWVEER